MPFFNFSKYEKTVNDMLTQLFVTLVVFLADSFAVDVFSYNNLIISFLGFIGLYLAIRKVIHATGQKKHFGTFANWSVHYCVFLSFFTWGVYVFFIRMRKFY